MPREEASAEYNRTACLISRALRSTEFRLFCAFCLLLAAFSILYPTTFPTAANVANMSRVAGVLFVVTAGQMCALLVGGFDLSVASNIGFVGVVTALGMTRYGGLPSGLMMGLVTGALIGLVNGGLIAWARLSPFIVTLGMLSFLLGFGNEIAHGAPIFGFPNGFEYLAVRDLGPSAGSGGNQRNCADPPLDAARTVKNRLIPVCNRGGPRGVQGSWSAGSPLRSNRLHCLWHSCRTCRCYGAFKGFSWVRHKWSELFAPINCCCGHWRHSHRRGRRYSARRSFGSLSPDGAVHGDGHRRIERVLPTYGNGVSNRPICACQPPVELADIIFVPVCCS